MTQRYSESEVVVAREPISKSGLWALIRRVDATHYSWKGFKAA